MRLSTTSLGVMACLFLFGLMSPLASAQDGNFDDLYLDGGAGANPFIRFDQPDGFPHYLVGFSNNMAFYVENGYKMRIYDDASSNTLVLDSNGVNIDGDVGISTSPGRIIKFEMPTGQAFGVRVLDSNSGLFNGGIGFSTDSHFYPLWVFDTAQSETLSLREEGVGIGTYSAMYPLHVYADGSPFTEAKVVVENDLFGDPQIREMFELINNGGTQFSFTDTSINSKWIFSSDSLGRFNVSLDGTGGPELAIRPDGRVIMGPGPVKNFDLRANGDLHLNGTLYQKSDRNQKADFAKVDADAVLEKIGDLDIRSWRYKGDESRHIGPVSQDFYQAFKLGEDDKSIATVDGLGVSLVAIQALHEQSLAKDKQIAELNAENALHKKTLAAQQEMLEQLQARIENLEATTQNN